jgi:hypothetical protein
MVAGATDTMTSEVDEKGTPVPVRPIEARCRRCHGEFPLFEVRVQRTGVCPSCGWMLTPDWTSKLLEDAAVADIAQRHLVNALRRLRNLPGNAVVRPHTVLRNLFEEVGWQTDLADDPEMLRGELRELRRLVAAWELLDPLTASAQPYRSWIQRFIAAITGTPPEPVVPLADGTSSSDGLCGDGDRIDRGPGKKQMAAVAGGS